MRIYCENEIKKFNYEEYIKIPEESKKKARKWLIENLNTNKSINWRLYHYEIADVMNSLGFDFVNRENIILLMLECNFDVQSPCGIATFNITQKSANKVKKIWVNL